MEGWEVVAVEYFCDGGDDGRRPDPGAVDRSPASMTGGGTHARGLGGWVGWPEFFFRTKDCCSASNGALWCCCC